MPSTTLSYRALPAAVVGDLAHARGEVGVVRGDHAGVAVGAEVLARVEAEARGVAEAARAPARDLGAVGLRRVLEDREPVALRRPRGSASMWAGWP